jgi:hypothetical protein
MSKPEKDMAGAEKKESFWKRHLVALIVGGFAVLLSTAES